MSAKTNHQLYLKHNSNLIEENEDFGTLDFSMHLGDYLGFFKFLKNHPNTSFLNIKPYHTWNGNFGHAIINAFNKRIIDIEGCPINRVYKFNVYDFYMLAKSFGLDTNALDYYMCSHLDRLESNFQYICQDDGSEKLRKMLQACQPGNLVSPQYKNYRDITFVFEE
jgi:hypothetical protein